MWRDGNLKRGKKKVRGKYYMGQAVWRELGGKEQEELKGGLG